METFLWMIGMLSYTIFFSTDFYLAFLLERFKKDHPSIVEATPHAGEEQRLNAEDRMRGSHGVDVGSDEEEEGDDAYAPVSAPLGHSSNDPQHHQQPKNTQHRAPYRGYPSSDDEALGATPSRMHGSTSAGLHVPAGGPLPAGVWGLHVDRNTTPKQLWFQVRRHPTMHALGFGRRDSALLLQNMVLFLTAFAPFLVFLQVIAPGSMGWSRFKMPAWLGYLTMLPGLGVVAFYAMRTYRVHLQMEVSKSQWMGMMWFRLDVICVMAAVMLLGWGDWLVAACLFTIDLYLAHRLLTTERRLVSTQGAEWLTREGRSGVIAVEDDEERFNQPARALVEIAQSPSTN